MKTTIEISDPLLTQAKRLATRRGTTMRALVERGLRHVIAEEGRAAKFKCVPVTDGLPDVEKGYDSMSWEQVRDILYEGRGA
jgi:predicted transcriptional regulator